MPIIVPETPRRFSQLEDVNAINYSGLTGESPQVDADGLNLAFNVQKESINAEWILQASTAMEDPGAGNFRRNALQTTQLVFSTTTNDGIDISTLIRSVNVGDIITVLSTVDNANGFEYRVIGTPIDEGTWFHVDVVLVDALGIGLVALDLCQVNIVMASSLFTIATATMNITAEQEYELFYQNASHWNISAWYEINLFLCRGAVFQHEHWYFGYNGATVTERLWHFVNRERQGGTLLADKLYHGVVNARNLNRWSFRCSSTGNTQVTCMVRQMRDGGGTPNISDFGLVGGTNTIRSEAELPVDPETRTHTIVNQTGSTLAVSATSYAFRIDACGGNEITQIQRGYDGQKIIIYNIQTTTRRIRRMRGSTGAWREISADSDHGVVFDRGCTVLFFSSTSDRWSVVSVW